ncbi:MAG: hypothetical protein AAB581_01325 [Patescibacteria group bacterium]
MCDNKEALSQLQKVIKIMVRHFEYPPEIFELDYTMSLDEQIKKNKNTFEVFRKEWVRTYNELRTLLSEVETMLSSK